MLVVRITALIAVLSSLILVTGCGGGGGSGGATPPIPPDQIQQVDSGSQTLSSTPTIQSQAQNSAAVSTAATSGIPPHVLTAAIVYGYGGTPTSVSIASVKPYVSWVQTDGSYAAQLRAAGMKVDIYENFWRNYAHDNPNVGYLDLKPGGRHAAAEARTCSGTVIRDPTYFGGYEADARSAAALGHAQVYNNYRLSEFRGNYDAIFTDDTNAMSGIPLPCGYSSPAYIASVNRINAALRVPIFFSAFGATADPPSQVPLLLPPNVIGGMCEICYAEYNRQHVDYPQVGGKWRLIEQAEIETVAQHKIFWDYARAIGDPVRETVLRKFIYASFLLTYDYRYTMLQVAFQSAHGFPIMPETGLVPMNPLTTAGAVTSYVRSGGAYMREFGTCYYRGVNHGRCAVVVNPGSSTTSVPSAAYAHSLVLVRGGVLDGGSVTFTGPRVSSLAPAAGAILFQ